MKEQNGKEINMSKWKHFNVYYTDADKPDRKRSRLIRGMSIKHARTIFRKKGHKQKIVEIEPTEVSGVSFNDFSIYNL